MRDERKGRTTDRNRHQETGGNQLAHVALRELPVDLITIARLQKPIASVVALDRALWDTAKFLYRQEERVRN